ncbi:IgGFc-binding protein [Microcaecilia unicolor]|uniref:Zonadhesin n=1 Tax=Microcaecilia unicolor TaxID=1415580 RepID=A0A6P7Z742_9AMPH|nr:IgGFc-binding protein-like [Microcaecilia unicolor]
MTACPATCVDPSAPENCNKPCIEGCECDDGYVLSGGSCVSRADCGCWYKDKYYTKGESFIDGNCENKCQCKGNNQVECVSVICGPDEICKVQNGLLGCYPASTATCHIYGDPHYTTFDGKVHHFQGSCNYTVAETCGNTSVSFSVTTRNEHRGNPSWTALNSVALTVNGIHIALRKHNFVYVNNGLLTNFPASPTPGVSISNTKTRTIISTNFGLELQFDGDQELFVRVKEYYKGLLCGLCGTYTSNQEDDFMKPDGVVVPDFNDFGNSWRVPDDEWPCNATTDPKPCPPALQQASEEYCKVLMMTNGPFSPCHSLIPPKEYFESCVYDQCATGGSSEQLCVVLASYAAACEAVGVHLGDWRNGTICGNATTITPTTTVSTSTTPSVSPSSSVDLCPVSCTFDDDFCHWTQAADDNFDWKRQKGPTPSSSTGPSYDHTTGNGYYIYIEGNDAGVGAVARLLSPQCQSQGPHCFRFWYHMFGVGEIMALKVSVLNNGILQNVFSQFGHKGDEWHFGEVLLDLSKNSQIILEGVRGNDYRSDVAMDDLSIVQGYCSVPIPSTPTTTIITTTVIPSVPITTSDSCVVEGDPHYYTFDNQVHHFMGTCKYTLSQLCNDTSLPYFNVEAANEHRDGNTHVSYVKYVDIDVYGNRITLEKNRVVKVNGVVEILPLSYSSGVQVSLSGQYVLLTTVFGLNVRFDGNHRVEVTLPSTYKGKVCGMCGNYNGNHLDDFLNPDGQMEPDSVSLGNSWQVANDTSCSPGPEHQPNCTEEEQQIIEGSSFCGIITDSNGPFRWCHSVLPPDTHFTNCIYDLCELQMDPDSLCRSLQSYADACQALGVTLEPWRNATFCPTHCPSNSHYELCGSACPATCVNPSAPSSCSLPCVEGCVCDNGFALYNDKCVLNNQCGCWKDGIHYPVGSAFWTDNTCSTRCSCPSPGSKLNCRNTTCPEQQYCGISNGEPTCIDYTYGICRVHNDPYYNTFDKEFHSFMGTCTYTLAKLCTNSTSLPYFNIEAKNENRGNSHVSYVQKVYVEVYDHKIVMIKRESSRVLVNEIWANLPVTLAGGSLKITRSGRYVVLETDFRLKVEYDTDHSVEVKVPITYFNLTCGMCGNFNSLRQDDYMMPDGQQAQTSVQLGNSWVTDDNDPLCIVPPTLIPPPVTLPPCEEEELCKLLVSKDAPFSVCHSVINPDSFYEACVLEYCAGNQVLCQALEVYADACQREGVPIPPWRNNTFCCEYSEAVDTVFITCETIPCPSNSHYNACMTACPATCVDPSAPENCNKPCIEGCECDDGYLLSGGSCVLRADCGCWYKDKYYTKGESFIDGNCENKCQCKGNNQVECVSVICGPDEICKVQNGLLGCYPASTATCHIYGDPHYTTFDGKVHHFQGSCNYTVAETCGNTSVSFSVTTRNEHRGNPSWTALNSVALTVNGIHIALRKHNFVYVNNGLLTNFPASLTPGVTISNTKTRTIISTNFGLELQFDGDQELFVRVKEYYKGLLCGLCGTYTSNQEDDFMKPDGVVVPDFNDFGNSWRVPDDEWPCNATTDPKPCPPALQQASEEYCKVLMMTNGPFSPCHSLIPPKEYFESCVYDQCATGGSSEQLCVVLASYAAACEAVGVHLGDWRNGTICGNATTTTPTTTVSTSTTPSVSPSSSDATTVTETILTTVKTLPPVVSTTAQSSTTDETTKHETSTINTELPSGPPTTTSPPSPTAIKPTTVPSSTTSTRTTLSTLSPKTTTTTQTTTKSPIIDRGTCSASGDPHYNTFDNKVHHYMGNCTYTLSRLCNQSTHLPYFDVSTSNEHRGSNTKVSYVKSVHVFVYGNLITLLKSKKVHVNGRKTNLPVSIGNGITVQISGSYVLLRTDFELWVRFDGNHYVDVTLPSVYKGQLCGLCGNYNGNPSDDIIKPDGKAAADSIELGDSWIVPENGTVCTNGTDVICDPVNKAEAEKVTACGMITDPSGVFKDCHTKVPPNIYFDNCVYDMCFAEEQSTSLCYALQSYAEQCTKAGICIEWRTSTFCPISCPGGSHFKSCGSSCSTTCSGPVTFSSCDSSLVEGCFCDEGYVLSGDRCVPENQCGCIDMNNNYYQAGESWFTQNNCAERCTCNGNNTISCTPWACGVQEKCQVQDGILGCHGTGKASCHVAGDPHYFTFDKVMHTFVGTCTYTLVQVCNTTNVIPVTISGKNEDRGQRGATYLKEVYVDVYNTRITLQKSRKTLFNQERVRTPVQGRTRGISIVTVGIYTVVETDFGMTVKFDGDHHLEIVLPDSYYSKVCGMCGNYNSRGDDELLMPNGHQARNVSEFGNSWKDELESDSGCLPDTRDELGPPCTAEQKPVIEGQCQVLLSDAFKPCHHLIKPQLFIQNCVYDMCKYDGMLSTLCAIAQSYVDACKREGVTIKWRNSTLCPLPCPTNSHYTDCAPPCPPTCNDIYASGTCDKPVACMEGCVCNDGHVLSDDQCVPLDNCGCRDDKDNYYPVGESWITPHCVQKCQCKKGNNIKCRSYGCEPGEICILNNKGNYACKPTGFAKCSITGDPHYLSFDGLVHHFQGKDTYIVVQTSSSISDSLPQFRIEGKNAPLITQVGVSYLKEISTNVYNHTVLFKQKKQLVLDGVRIDPPAQPHEGIRISQRSTRIYMETDFGLSVSFDGAENADITLPNTYKKKVEGLCGNFDGKYNNDFTKPDGTKVNNVNVFGESWKVQNGKTTLRLRQALTSEEESDVEELNTGFQMSCSPSQLKRVNSSSYCGLLTDPSGPFKAAHQTIAADLYSLNCIFDLCTDIENTVMLCSNLGQYALDCQEAGITIGDWRENSRCGKKNI